METRLLVAYGLVALMMLAGGSWYLLSLPRRRARKLRMRGIKVDQASARDRREAVSR